MLLLFINLVHRYVHLALQVTLIIESCNCFGFSLSQKLILFYTYITENYIRMLIFTSRMQQINKNIKIRETL